MKHKFFAPMFLVSFLSVILFKLEAANAQSSAIKAIQTNADDVVKNAPSILAFIMALFTQNPVLGIVLVVIILFIAGNILSQAS
ncbi:hypothetical protein [Microcoleus sp. CAWBG640]|uniref:hypothetical protein n=1 Tax=Microcoleus sp. CAWBG640 TaxID=2841653 RepID=UPI00312BCA21